MLVTIGVVWERDPTRLNVYAGKGGPLGNPYAHSMMSFEERMTVCDQYEVLFKEQMGITNSPIARTMHKLLNHLNDGIGINLQCYCKPKRCHCETIKAYLDANTYTDPVVLPVPHAPS